MSASGWAEETRPFSQKNSRCEFFVKKKKAYHAAAGESGHHRAQTPSLQTHRVTRVNKY
jgi:hypothetical protein